MKKSSTPVIIFCLVFLILLSIPILLPYFHQGYFPTHDGEWAVVRLTEMFREIKDMQIPPRYSTVLNFGYGYPLFNFAYPFPYYLGVIIRSVGLSFVDTVKIIFAVTVPLSAVAMFFLSKDLWKSSSAGFFSAVIYLYYPYRMIDLYVRGSIGESLAFVFFPVIALCILWLLKKPHKYIFVLVGGVLLGILILTHNIMALLFAMLIGMVIGGLILTKQFLRLRSIVLMLLIGVGISCYFWLPALYEKQFIILSQIPIADRDLYYVTLERLVLPMWGFAPPTEQDGFSYQIGIAHLGAFLLLIAVLIKEKISDRKFGLEDSTTYALVLIASIIVLAILLFPISSVIWEHTPLLREINYPWTLLLPIGFLLSLCSGYLFTKDKYVAILGKLIVIASIFFVLPYAQPEEYVNRGDNFYMTNDATTTSSSEYMPLWVKENPFSRPDQRVVLSNDSTVEIHTYESDTIFFTTSAPSRTKATVNTIYYPGWEAKINGQNTLITYNNKFGAMEIAIPEGKSHVELSFTETPVRLISNSISIISGTIVGVIFLYTIINKRIILKRKKK